MDSWKLKPIHCTTQFHEYYRKSVKKFGYTQETHWRYFTFMHMVGAKKHNTDLTHRMLLEQFQNGTFYSRATVEAMEAKYLQRIASLARCKECTADFNRAAQTVAFRASLTRQSCRSKRPGKIQNH